MAYARNPLVKAAAARSYEHTPGGVVRFFHGDEHGLDGVSVAMSTSPPGDVGLTHRQPCAEVFVVCDGRGVYTVDGVEVLAEAGDIVVVPPNTWHSFHPDGDAPMRHVATFSAMHVDTEVRRP